MVHPSAWAEYKQAMSWLVRSWGVHTTWNSSPWAKDGGSWWLPFPPLHATGTQYNLYKATALGATTVHVKKATKGLICFYRPCACVGVVRILYLKVYDFPHTRRHFVGQWNSSNVHINPFLAPYQQYWQLDCLVAHICYKANSNVCHTAVILDVVHRSVQPAHNLVAV